MGGRGASSGLSRNKNGEMPYGTEFKTLAAFGNIKFVQYNNGSATPPLETMTNGRVYVTVNNNEKIKYISYYNNENKKVKTIDLSHKHNGLQPHVHHGYLHSEDDSEKGATGLTQKEKRMVDRVNKIWYTYKGK